MSSLLNKITQHLKANKCSFEIEETLIIVSKGSYNIYIQLENMNESNDFDFFSLWVTNKNFEQRVYEDEFNSLEQHDSIEGVLDNALDRCKEMHKAVSKINSLFEKIEELANENSIDAQTINTIFEKLKFENYQ